MQETFTRVGQACYLEEQVFFGETFGQHEKSSGHGTFQIPYESGPQFSRLTLKQNLNLEREKKNMPNMYLLTSNLTPKDSPCICILL